ncbi:general transcription factor II-I repeat domain-containing protein 2B-like [Diabrotica virgifera virgifera]|uniref:HAT C-terminal dimerisation domain-containing protein n=2 Tax=Diabrotica virgifera virgifera TaxID=50390 RepID=A0ABM5ISV5_DIAVI|nr:general transcription factor II-I repeat domain-containing protein 2B-like [Diabrotica virgifera virgifera]
MSSAKKTQNFRRESYVPRKMGKSHRKVLAVSKEYNISRHYETQHKTKYDKYQGEARNILEKELKAKLNKQKSLFTKPTAVQSSSLAASYEGKNKTVSQLVGQIETFRKKLDLFENCMKINDLTHFPACFEINQEETMVDFSRFAKVLTEIKREFNERISKFDALKPDLELFNNPMGVNIQNQSAEYQLELFELQSDSIFQAKKNEDISTFGKLVSNRFPKLRNFAVKLYSMFGSTYICESTFSALKHIKSKTRNRMENDSLEACISLTTSIDIDVQKLVEDKPLPQISL